MVSSSLRPGGPGTNASISLPLGAGSRRRLAETGAGFAPFFDSAVTFEGRAAAPLPPRGLRAAALGPDLATGRAADFFAEGAGAAATAFGASAFRGPVTGAGLRARPDAGLPAVFFLSAMTAQYRRGRGAAASLPGGLRGSRAEARSRDARGSGAGGSGRA